MKTSLLSLFLCLAAIACGDGLQNIPLTGCYCDEIPGVFRSGALMVVGENYRLTNGTSDAISVIPAEWMTNYFTNETTKYHYRPRTNSNPLKFQRTITNI